MLKTLTATAMLLALTGCAAHDRMHAQHHGEKAVAQDGHDAKAHDAKAMAHGDAHWGYVGAEGPEFWGSLSDDFKACGVGAEQSPIDLTGAIEAKIDPLGVHWGPASAVVANNGHTIQVNVADGSTLTIGDETYTLKQFHFHRQSEHAIDGRLSPMEVHFVHTNDHGAAVVGVMIEEGAPNPLLETVFAAMPAEPGEAALPAPVDGRALLPGSAKVYRYAGSLTTPPCSEVVAWNVLATPVTASKAQIDAFAALFPHNNRPLVPANRRFLLTGQAY